MKKGKPFVRSALTKALIRCLEVYNKGDVVTYGDISNAVGQPITSDNSCLRSARKALQDEQHQVWICEQPKIGLRRLTDPEIAERLPRWHLKGARNKVRRGSDQATVVDYSKLDINEQSRFSVSSIQAQLAADALSRATTRRLEKVSRGNSNDLPKFNAVEWAISLMPGKPKNGE